MVFVTIGTQAPFDRFIKIIDKIAADIDEEIIVQTPPTSFVAQHIKIVDFISPDRFNDYIDNARIVVAHAGMGSIISSLSKGKPIIVFPRLASLGEHRNEHQMATARQLEKMHYVYAAYEETTLRKLITTPSLAVPHRISSSPSKNLIDSLQTFIDSI